MWSIVNITAFWLSLKRRTFIAIIIILIPLFSYAGSTWNIEIRGSVTAKGIKLKNSLITIYGGALSKRVIESPNGDFDFFLQPDTNYLITFTKVGYITKCVSFSTKNVPSGRAAKGFSPYDIEVEIYPKIAGVDDAPLIQAPLAIVKYDSTFEQGDFTSDTKYAESIAPFLSILDYEMKQTIKQAQMEKLDMLKNEELKRQRFIIYFSGIILILVSAFALYILFSYRQKKRINAELDFKNRKIEEKNLEITDSINYAKTIQNAMMPDYRQLGKILPESFILFRPKAIVSGDFYFFLESNNKIFLAAADCTGHGVPGAFMSLIGYDKLAEAVNRTMHVGEALSVVNKGIKDALRQSSSGGSSHDGMDIALCAIEMSNDGMKINYSGANRPLWIIRKDTREVKEIIPTKKGIGGFTDDEQQFDIHELQLTRGDCFYLFSDGYADQFGGMQGKKFSKKRFKELLVEANELPMTEQMDMLDEFILKWKEKEEQIDDILVIGVRV